ncbi:MAG TPA: hypothetical protein VHL09_02310, partial [Dehalococcoidia bacterium]|nr:hypothetical protein [Dehalococcoidia bacterium]
MGYLRQTLDRIRTRPAADEWLIDTGLSLTGAVFALAVPVWLVCTVALVWRHGALEPVFALLSVFAGLFVIAGIAYGAGYLGWLAVARWLRGLVARVAATWPRGLAPAIMGICAALGVVLALAASIPLVTVTSQLTAFPAQGQFRLDAPYQTYESVDQASARSIVPLLVDLRQATDGGRAFSDRPLAQPQPSRPLLIEPAGNLPIDPMTALGILAVLEALVALVRRGRIGLSGHALALTGLAGLGYLVALP